MICICIHTLQSINFSFWVFFNRMAFGFASRAINETSSSPVSRVYCKAKYSAFKIAQEERMNESVGKYRPTIGRSFWSYEIYAFFMDSCLCSRYTTTPPLYQRFSSSFRFRQFSLWNIEIRNMSKRYSKNEGLIVYLRNVYTLEQFPTEIYGKKVLNI